MREVDISIIFVYYNTPREILNAVKSVKKACEKYNYEVIIVDNDSKEKIPPEIHKFEKVKYIRNKNIGYGLGLNKGAENAKGKYLLFSNSDLLFTPGSIEKMIDKLESDLAIGIIGPAFLDKNKKIRKVGNSMPFFPQVIFALSSLNKLFPSNYFSNKYFLKEFDRKSEREIPVICGACMMIRKNIFKEIGKFDKRFFMYFEEADICYRVSKKGLRVLYYPSSKVIHYVGRSSANLKWIEKTFEKSRFEFLKKYYGVYLGTFFEVIIRTINLPASFI